MRDSCLIRLSYIASRLGGRMSGAVRAFGGPLPFVEAYLRGRAGRFEKWLETMGLSEKLPSANQLDAVGRRLRHLGARIFALNDPGYPPLLKTIAEPPLVLYSLGEAELLRKDAVAVVGTRRPSSFGRCMAERIAREIAAYGVTVVSGLAFGVDKEAHQAALETGGATVAVMACGIDRCAPQSNRTLWRMIIERGCVVTEYGPGMDPRKHFFPWRNRIISGISLGVVVVEAAERSGALITADYALAQGREVFAVPGSPSIGTSGGPNRLIRDGAKLVESGEDVLEEFPQLHVRTAGGGGNVQLEQLSDGERRVYESVCAGISETDGIVEATRFSTSEVLADLALLEMKGFVKKYGRKFFSTTRRS